MRRLVPALVLALLGALAVPAASEPEPRIDCENAMSTYEMNVCAERDFKAADDALNAAYRDALKKVPGLAIGEIEQFNAAAWEKALRQSQRAWLAFRDAECRDHIPMFWSGGTGTTVAVLGCMIEKTKARTKELIENYETK
ncbi:MAG: DUF1311 domain-containing protein [Hyphomicrobiaceae bacterium]|nr:DUF1311 domain-containing protein [Hyphomicrobiaceae bacterium]